MALGGFGCFRVDRSLLYLLLYFFFWLIGSVYVSYYTVFFVVCVWGFVFFCCGVFFCILVAESQLFPLESNDSC